MAEKHLKEHSISLVIRVMQMETTLRFFYNRITKINKRNNSSCWWGCGVSEHSSVVSGRSMWQILDNLGIDLLQNSDIPFFGIYSKDYILQERHFSTMFIAALLITARNWKYPRCASTDNWVRKMWYIYTTEYYSAIKKRKTMKFTGKWMELEKENFPEWGDPDPKRQIWYVVTYIGY